MNQGRVQTWVIWSSLLLALVLMHVSLPPYLLPLRPLWLAMVVLYWGMIVPEQFGMGTAFFGGLVEDSLQGALFGLNALALVVIVFIVTSLSQRIQMYRPWQQLMLVCAILLVHQLILCAITAMITGRLTVLFFVPVLVSMVFWPWLYLALRRLRLRYQSA